MAQDPSLKRSQSKFDLQAATNIALLAVTSLAAVVLVRDLFNGGSGTGANGPKVFAVDSAATANAEVGTVVGGAGREVRLLMFSDFQCPFCANYRHVIDSVLSDATLPVEVRLVHYPLSYHARAVEAAEFFECAAIEGAPSAAHDALFERQSLLDTLDLSALAGIVSPANPQFWERCDRDGDVARRLRIDAELVTRLQLSETPTIMLGKWQYESPPSSQTLAAAIRRVHRGKRPANSRLVR